MKKQINPTIKAHLIRGAFYLLLLLAVCAIPFALAQSRSRGNAMAAAKPDGAAKENTSHNLPAVTGAIGVSAAQALDTSQAQSQVPAKSSRPGIPAFSMPPMPKLPQVVSTISSTITAPNATLSATFTGFPDLQC